MPRRVTAVLLLLLGGPVPIAAAATLATYRIYVQSFPGPGAKSQVSRNGGSHPVWRADGRELFYLGPDGTMMAVAIGAGHSFDAGVRQALFSTNVWRLTGNEVYAVTKDGQRFLVNATPQQSSGLAPLTVVPNWTAAIHR